MAVPKDPAELGLWCGQQPSGSMRIVTWWHALVDLTPVSAVVRVVAAALVYFDARRRDWRYGSDGPYASNLGAVGWALGVLIAPVLFVPGYAVRLWVRRRAAAGSAPQPDDPEHPVRLG